MLRSLIVSLVFLTLSFGQSSLDILTNPTDTRDASLGINLNPVVKPTLLLSPSENLVTLNVWNWVADVQGAYIGVGKDNSYFSVQAMRSGEIEYRDDKPSEDPLSTFEYTLFNFGAAHARQFQGLSIGLGSDLIYERTLNASATGLSFNLALAYTFNDHYSLSGGLAHFGFTGKLDNESTDLPTALWAQVDANFNDLSILAELNNSPIPVSIGASYQLIKRFEILAGLQYEATEPNSSIHPSVGFTAAWTNFTLGYSLYQLDHTLGAKQFISLYWIY